MLLYIYTKQKSLNKLKSILRYEKHKDNHWKNIAKDYQNVDDYLDFKEMQQSMYSAVSCLTPTQQKIFLLSREEGLSHSEIAEKLNISQNTVKNHMVTALTTLRKFFKDHEIMTLAIFIGIN